MDSLQGGQKNLLWNGKCLKEDVMLKCCHLGKSFQNTCPQDHDQAAHAESKTCRIIGAAASTAFSIPGVRTEMCGFLREKLWAAG